MSNKEKTNNRITSKQQIAGMHNFITSIFTNPRKRKKMLLVVLTIFIIALTFDLLIGGNIRFYTKWVECGQKPVVAGSLYEGLVPYYEETSSLPSIRLRHKQFCSPYNAEMHAYSSDKHGYDFPNLSHEENTLVREKYLFL